MLLRKWKEKDYRLDGQDFIHGECKIGSEAHPAPDPMGTGGKAEGAWSW
jgi:hypothetical protein